MLAYLFWHWPPEALEATAVASYEARQAAFHRALAETGAEGFVESRRYAVSGAGWLPGGSGYEDWYLVEGSFALDSLNDAVVGKVAGQAHREATIDATGIGGLYRLLRGVPEAASGPVSWVTKARAEAYADFYARLPAEAVVWRRVMVLGPAPEFIVEGPPPPGVDAQVVSRRLL